MRIERVVIENLNSLLGRFEIDLTDRAYAGGLFAIVGPSGAGKTTILDAICLALYGRTPRIDSISETQDELMNKNAASCRAEVVFTVKGKRYKSVFMHERARGSKPFRAVRRELLVRGQDGVWHVEAAKIREVDEKISAICGFDYARFTRSIMLAQFRFAEFLQASSNDRAAILEQITDMDIYRRISVAVYERAKRQREILMQIRSRIDEVRILSEAEESARRDELQQLEQAVATHEAAKEALSECGAMAEQLTQLQNELAQYKSNEKPLEDACTACAATYAQAIKDEKTQADAFAALRETLKIVRALDQDIKAQAENIVRIEKEMEADKRRINEHKNNILEIFKKYEPSASKERYRQMYDSQTLGPQLRENAMAARDAAQTNADRIRTQLNEVLKQKDEAYWQARQEFLKKELLVCESREALEKARQDLLAYTQQAQTLEKETQALESQAKVAEERFEYARLHQRYGEERRKLVTGQPCPLCGATEHPRAQEDAKDIFFDEAERAYRAIQSQRDALQKRVHENRLRMDDTQKLIEEKEAFLKQHPDVQTERGSDAVRQEQADIERMLNLAITLRQELTKATEQVTAMTQRFGDVDKDVHAIDSRKQMIAEIEQARNSKEQELSDTQRKHAELEQKRHALLGDRDADTEERAAQKRLDASQAQREKCRASAEQAERALEQNRKDILRTEELISARERALSERYEAAITAAYTVQNASDDDDVIVLFDQYTDAVSALGESPDAGALKNAAAALHRLITGEAARLGSVRQVLKTNEEGRKQVREYRKAETQAKKEMEKWEQLNALIGSASGDKFSRMAQSITFDALLRYANQSLRRMSDRYILQRYDAGPAKPMELAVIDNDQAGEKRPVANLSGGESFIVSLALALGLSEMSSGAARIDSLFIDEGFASLDEDYMEAALQTLSALGNREGKLIGIISHVEALKSRIDVQIEVSHRSGGCAALFGPGVVSAVQ